MVDAQLDYLYHYRQMLQRNLINLRREAINYTFRTEPALGCDTHINTVKLQSHGIESSDDNLNDME